MAKLAPPIKQRFFDNDGFPLANGKLYTYEAGSAGAVLKPTYKDAALMAANTNPIILDSRGECILWLDGKYLFMLTDSADNEIWTVDNVGESSTALSFLSFGVGAEERPISDKFNDLAVSPEDYGAIGDGITNDQSALLEALNALKAAGGGVFAGSPGAVYRVDSSLYLDTFSNIKMEGNGASIFRQTAGTACNALTLSGCENLEITGWRWDSSYNGFTSGSTGSNPNILLTAAGKINKNIRIHGNSFNNGNHANIVIGTTGIDALYSAGSFPNQDIWIYNNRFGNAGVSVFVYKGTSNYHILNNTGENFSNSAMGLDTHAAGSDADTKSYPIEHGDVRGNVLKNVVTTGIYQGRGCTIKGAVNHLTFSDNKFWHIESTGNYETFGILIVPDQRSVPQTGYNIKIMRNFIYDVHSSEATVPGTAGWALRLGKGFSDILIDGNSFHWAERGIELSDQSSWRFINNYCFSLSTVGGYPLRVVYEGSASTFKKLVDGNTFVKSSGAITTAIGPDDLVSSIHFGINNFEGFTSKTNLPAGVVYTCEDVVIGTGIIAYAGGVVGPAVVAPLGTITVPGALTTDMVRWASNNVAGYREAVVTPGVTAADTVNLYARNPHDANNLTLPAATLRMTVLRESVR